MDNNSYCEFFYVIAGPDWHLTTSFQHALTLYYICKKYHPNDIKIVDAITDRLIFK